MIPQAAAQNQYTVTTEIPFKGKGPDPLDFHGWTTAALDSSFAQRWNQIYPYEFVLVTATTDDEGATTYAIAQGPLAGRFTLPISPQDLTIDMPFASDVTATLGDGVIEEHAGAPFRMIQMSGTTGMAPFRKSTEAAGSPGVLESVFGGTVQAAQNVAASFETLTGTANMAPNLHSGLGTEFGPDSIPYESTGYYQFHLLKRFLEAYSALKKSGKHPELRLCFAIHKDNEFYLVTPQRLGLKRSAGRAREYLFDISLKAWKRVDLNGYSASARKSVVPPMRDPGALATALNKINQARAVVQDSTKVLNAVAADVDNILGIARGAALFLKDVAGFATTLADLPGAILSNIADTRDKVVDTASAAADSFSSFGDRIEANTKAGADKLAQNSSSKAGRKAGIGSYGKGPDAAYQKTKQGLTDKEDPAARAAREQTPVSSLKLPRSILQQVAKERARVRAFTRSDFQQQLNDVQRFADNFAERVGAGDANYAAAYGRGDAGTRTPTYEEMRVLWALQTIAQQLKILSMSDTVSSDRVLDSLQYVGALASASDITFVQPKSRFFVPYEYGATLEQLALRYLGDANRWHEIATLNQLRAPYVDETGFELPLLVNGDVNVAIVADGSKLEVGQACWLWSETKARSKRTITGVEKVATDYWRVQVSGTGLDEYLVADGAYLFAYLPATVNSQKLIAIPSQDPGVEDNRLKYVPGTNDLDGLLKVGGIDLLLDGQNDLVLNAGDFVPAFGLQNIIQSIRIALGTPRGSLLQHPGYGLAIEAGVSTADIQTPEILQVIQNLLASDPAIARVESANVAKKGTTLAITISVVLKGGGQSVPLTFALNAA